MSNILILREIREKQGISVPKLAELSGVPRRTIQDLELRGDCMISTALKLTKALGVTLNDIVRPCKAPTNGAGHLEGGIK